MSTAPLDIKAAHLLLQELRRLQLTVAEAESVRRLDALDRIEDAIERIAEIGTSAGILERAAEELGHTGRFHRVLVSEIEGQLLIPRRLWSREPDAERSALDAQLERIAIPLAYPLVEAEIAAHPRGQRSWRTQTVVVEAWGPRSPEQLREVLRWERYVASAIRVRGEAIGILHAQPAPAEQADEELDREVVSAFADGLGGSFERAALQEVLRRHHEELRFAVTWIGEQLARPGEIEHAHPPDRDDQPSQAPSVDALTPRESEIVGLLGRGRTNASIAQSLLISESTVKFHVKNILLKLGATSRADAVARHMRGGR